MKKTFSIILAISILFGVSGCMNTADTGIDVRPDPEGNTQEKMLSYLSEKYNDTFTVAGLTGGGAGITYMQMFVRSEKYPEKEIAIECRQGEDGPEYADNYTHLRFENDMAEFFESFIREKLSADVIVSYYAPVPGTVNRFSDKTDFEEFISGMDHGKDIFVVVSDEFRTDNFEETVNRIKEAFSESGTMVDAYIYFAQSEETFRPYRELKISERDKMRMIRIFMDRPGMVSEIKWR